MIAHLFARLILAAVSCASDHRAVFEREGRIMLRSPSGTTVPLTATGRDFDPFITTDGTAVVFCRRDANHQFRTTIHQLDVRSGSDTLLVSPPVIVHGWETTEFGSPQLNTERQALYFIVFAFGAGFHQSSLENSARCQSERFPVSSSGVAACSGLGTCAGVLRTGQDEAD